MMDGSSNLGSGRARSVVERTSLLTALLDGLKTVERVEIKRVDMPADLASGAHLHPCPVVGIVLEGSILFQVAGKLSQVLMPGDAFYEPAGARVEHFDAQGQGASFVAHYLLGPNEDRLIEMLDAEP